jgi:hypothetical protein
MKKALIIFSALFLFMLMAQTGVDAQLKSRKELQKDRKALMDRVKDKAIKEARKQADEYEKEFGWRTFEGDVPMPKMLEQSWMKQLEMRQNPDGSEANAYIWATGNGVAKTKSAAEMQAIELAKVELAGQLKTFVAALTTSNIANAQITGVDAETEQNIVQSAKNITSATLTQIKPVVKMYRNTIPKKGLKKSGKQQLAPGVTEVQVILFYDLYQADFQTRDAIKEELKDKMKDNEEELKKLMDL